MTLDEAKKVGKIIEEADSGCPYCVDALRQLCQQAFPQFSWTMDVERSCNVRIEAISDSDGGECD